MKFKYILFDTVRGVPNVPVIFPTFIDHQVIANTFRSEVISAGFCEFDEDHFYGCSGESVSLKKASRNDEDTKLIKRAGMFQELI